MPEQNQLPAGSGQTPPANPPPGQTQPNQTSNSEFKIPEAYASKEWAQNIKSSDQVWKEMDNLQSLLGKPRINLLDATATPEQRAEWRSKLMREHLGAPADAAGYEPDYTNAPEFKDYKRPEDMDKALKSLMAKHAVPKEFGSELLTAYDRLVVASAKKKAEMSAQLAKEDEAFKGTVTKTFGPDAEVKVSAALAGLSKVLPAEAVPMLATLDATGKAMLAVVADHFSRRYTGEGLLGAAGAGAAGAGETVESLRAELHKLVADPRIQNQMHPDYSALRQKQEALERRIWDLKKNQK